jgi:hypothetical protein
MTWWYKFRFSGQMIREFSKSKSKTVAEKAERSRRRELEESFNRISRPRTAQLFSTAADGWLRTKIAHLSPRSVIIEQVNLRHINPYFGKMLLCDVAADDIARYQAERLEQGAAPKTVNLEVGTLRAILRPEFLFRTLTVADVHYRSDKLNAVRFIAWGMSHNMDVFDGAIRHHQAIFMLKILPILRRSLNRLFHQGCVVRMNPLEDKFEGWYRRSVVLKDPKGFLGPEDLTGGEPPAEAPRMTEPLRFRCDSCARQVHTSR